MGRNKIYTDDELKKRKKQYMKEYNAKPEIKQRKREHNAKPETKQRKKEYEAKPETKQLRKEYEASPNGKQRKKEHEATRERNQYMKEYKARPEVWQRNKEYSATPERKQYMKEYNTTPEIKQRNSRRVLVRRSKGGYVSNIERQLIYERDAYKCAYPGCNKVVIVGAINSNPLQATIDHIIPISKGGLSIYSNMITMCRGCNCNTKMAGRLSDESRLLELAHARNIEFGLVDSKTKWEKGQQDDRVAGMGGG